MKFVRVFMENGEIIKKKCTSVNFETNLNLYYEEEDGKIVGKKIDGKDVKKVIIIKYTGNEENLEDNKDDKK